MKAKIFLLDVKQTCWVFVGKHGELNTTSDKAKASDLNCHHVAWLKQNQVKGGYQILEWL